MPTILAPEVHVAIPRTAELPPGTEGHNWALFLSKLALLTSLTRERRDRGHWINIHNDVLRAMLGGGYRKRIKAMVAAGFIEVNEPYSTGTEVTPAFTKSYRLAWRHRTGESKLHLLTTVPTASKGTKMFEVDEDNLGVAGMHFRNCFDRFLIDPAAVNDVKLRNHWGQWTIARWFNGQEFSRRCDYGRYHGLATQLPRKARKHLRTLEGERIAIVDVSACQPLLLGLIASLHPHPQTHKRQSAGDLLPYGARFCRATVAQDVRKWVELCENREFYDHFYEAIQNYDGSTLTTIIEPSGRPREVDLRDYAPEGFKRCTFVPLFGTVESMLRSPIFAITQRDFPTIANFMVWAKRHRHQGLACLLQSTESSLMIDRVGGVLADQYADVAVQPCHDALFPQESFAHEARDIIKQEFEKVGLKPNVKVEKWRGASRPTWTDCTHTG